VIATPRVFCRIITISLAISDLPLQRWTLSGALADKHVSRANPVSEGGSYRPAVMAECLATSL